MGVSAGGSMGVSERINGGPWATLTAAMSRKARGLAG